jgi:small subunit ribosomal protein S20
MCASYFHKERIVLGSLVHELLEFRTSRARERLRLRYPEIVTLQDWVSTLMANTVSSLKRVRVAERRTVINRKRKSQLRHQIRDMRRLLDQKDATGASKLVPATFSLVDRAAKWGIIKKNTAARYKSRLSLRLRRITAA